MTKRGPALLGVLLVGLIAFGFWFANQGSQEDTPAPVASASPTPEPTPSPASAEAEAEAEIRQLVEDYTALTNEIYFDVNKPINDIEQLTRGELREARITVHLGFRNAGNIVTSGSGVIVHSVAVRDLDLSADPATATVTTCESVQAVGTGPNGEPADWSTGRESGSYTAEKLPVDGTERWVLTDSVVEAGSTC